MGGTWRYRLLLYASSSLRGSSLQCDLVKVTLLKTGGWYQDTLCELIGLYWVVLYSGHRSIIHLNYHTGDVPPGDSLGPSIPSKPASIRASLAAFLLSELREEKEEAGEMWLFM